LIAGLTTAVLAVAFSTVYLPTRVFHVALGGIYAAVPFVAWACANAGWPPLASVAAAVAVGIALSFGTELLNHGPLEKRQASSGAHLVASLGAYTVMVAGVSLIWGNETKVLRTGIDQTFIFGGVVLTQAQVVAAIVAIFLIAAFYLLLKFTNIGLQFRALADNPVEFALRGYNVERLRLLAFGVSGALGSASALLVAHDVGFDPHGGLPMLLLAVVAVIIGGKQSFAGPALGAILLGLIRAEVVWFTSARWQDAATFLLLAICLYVRPQGLLGRKQRLEATT
jgi:branched-chain amino acid transport system permease protein